MYEQDQIAESCYASSLERSVPPNGLLAVVTHKDSQAALENVLSDIQSTPPKVTATNDIQKTAFDLESIVGQPRKLC